jgi:hypothetical protein
MLVLRLFLIVMALVAVAWLLGRLLALRPRERRRR